jgi:hypothetical protein
VKLWGGGCEGTGGDRWRAEGLGGVLTAPPEDG